MQNIWKQTSTLEEEQSGYRQIGPMELWLTRHAGCLAVHQQQGTEFHDPSLVIDMHTIRRIDLKLGVAYKESIRRVEEVLFEVADLNLLCREEPKPLLIFLGFGDSSIDLQFSVWARRENYLGLLNSIQTEIEEVFDAQGIEIPFPHRTLYSGAVTESFPVRVVGKEGSPLSQDPRTGRQVRRFLAAIRMRRALSLMNPSASPWW